MNESTFEAHINNILKQFFPYISDLKITHQKYFRIQLGHSEYKIRNNIKKGFADILISIHGNPCILFELKKKSEVIDKDVVKQALSYARLTENITPITIVSNSEITEIYNSYTGKPIETETIKSFSNLKKFIENSLSISNDNIEESINNLFWSNYNFICEIILESTTKKFKEITANKLDDFLQPINSELIIERNIVNKIISNDSNYLLYGNPYCGKTNTLYQIFSNLSKEFLIFYFDLNYFENIIEEISLQLTDILGIEINVIKTRRWLLNISNYGKKCYFLLDNFNIKNEKNIHSFIKCIKTDNINIIITIDESIKDNAISNRGRNGNTIISDFVKYNINNIDKEDFLSFIESKNIMINHGFRYYSEFNKASYLKWIILPILINFEREEYCIEIPSIPTASNLFSYSKYVFNNINKEIIILYQKLATLFLEEQAKKFVDEYLGIYSVGKIFLQEEIIKSKFGDSELDLLINSGFLDKKLVCNKYILYFPKEPYLILYLLKTILKDKILLLCTNDIHNAGEIFYELIYGLPFFDSFSSSVIVELMNENANIAMNIIDWLYKNKPVREEIKSKKINGILSLHNSDPQEFSIKTEDGESLTKDLEPWVILSQILFFPFEHNGNIESYLALLYEVGSYGNILMRIDSYTSSEVFYLHDFGSNLVLLCSLSGFIEPITNSIKRAILTIPNPIKELFDLALTNNNLPLIYRFYTAVENIGDNYNLEIQKLKKYIKLKYDEQFTDKLNNYLAGRDMKLEDECYCGSKLKYKNCCKNNQLM